MRAYKETYETSRKNMQAIEEQTIANIRSKPYDNLYTKSSHHCVSGRIIRKDDFLHVLPHISVYL